MSQSYILPPFHTTESFDKAIEEFRAILGAEHVEIVDSTKLDDQSYHDPPKTHDPFHIIDQDELVASIIIRPGSTEDVQEIVKAANRHRFPLWPVSIGRNFGYGGAAPRVRGSAVVDLGARMNKILELDNKQAFTLLEPGVTYKMLYEEIQRKGYNLWIDVPDLGGGSVLGNATERGVGYTPYGDHFMMHCGMEIVLPNGELIRTGMGSLPDKSQPTGSANTWQLFPYGFGPYHDGLFTQSNYGIVTKIGMWLMPDPGGYQSYMITFSKDSDLYQAIEIIRPLRLANILQNVPSIRSATLDIAVAAPRSDFSSTGKPLTEEELEAAIKKVDTGIERWNFYGALYGPEPVRNVMWEAIKSAFGTIEGAKFYLPTDLPEKPGSVLHIRDGTLRGIPSTTELNWTNWMPNGGTLFFSPISPVTGEDAVKQYDIAKKRFTEFGFDYIGTFTVGMRELHHIIIAVYDRKNPEEKRRAFEMYKLLVQDCADAGYGEYRTHLALMDQIAGTYNWNGNSIMQLNQTIKDALDPNGIMAPGKSGVWPKQYRDLKK